MRRMLAGPSLCLEGGSAELELPDHGLAMAERFPIVPAPQKAGSLRIGKAETFEDTG